MNINRIMLKENNLVYYLRNLLSNKMITNNLMIMNNVMSLPSISFVF